ncbi:solute carrier family 35 member E2 isoform X2 [Cephus cinctus]|uniref:Solute carrier family 35 member E2 isoform X2 n=1 Tax=Cephus cinctus TaxID=211228 RepID=A0AAJ7FDI2_CEPCN|nr:solute carrier family 35 member E2 isoform X2 [Cephus cinctus]
MDNHSIRINYTQSSKDAEEITMVFDNPLKQHDLKKREGEALLITDTKGGLFNPRALLFLILWYVFSGCTLFLNKYILSYMEGDPTILGACQMLMTAICGFIQMYFPCGEHTGLYVNLSLIPVMGGLALCSANEISFDLRGFVAAMATNLTECLQNVYSKMLISGDNFKYTPAELQFYTSLASIVVQIPVSILLVDLPTLEHSLSFKLFSAFLLNGVFFHFQSITAYVLMDYISPVTHSVANTAKRAFLIWLSVLLFNNPVTGLSALGTSLVIIGVLLYNRAQQYDRMKSAKVRSTSKVNLQ